MDVGVRYSGMHDEFIMACVGFQKGNGVFHFQPSLEGLCFQWGR
jgi:hypothetical protein